MSTYIFILMKKIIKTKLYTNMYMCTNNAGDDQQQHKANDVDDLYFP